MPSPRIRLPLLLILLSLLLAGPVLAWGDCRHKADRAASLDAGGAERIVIDARAGDLDVRGVSGTQIRARGVACADRVSDLEGVRIVTERDGTTVRVIAEISDRRGRGDNARLDLELEVPAGVPLEISDSSGDMDVHGVHVVRVTDSSGNITLRDTVGELRLDDSSGDISLAGHRGNVTLSDSSGDMRLRDIEGSVVVQRDSSGDIVADRVSGSVIVEIDSSGDIRVSDVGGDFVVERDGSGDIDYRDVRGRVDVPRSKKR